MAHKVKCFYCGCEFDRDKEQCVKVSERRYAHAACASKKAATADNYDKQAIDYANLERYVKQLFGDTYLDVKVKKEIMEYHQQYGYSYSGMQKTLYWFYEIKKNPIEKANGGIAIIPWIYKEASEYFFTLYQASETNKNKSAKDISINKEIIINTPKPNPWKARKIIDMENL